MAFPYEPKKAAEAHEIVTEALEGWTMDAVPRV